MLRYQEYFDERTIWRTVLLKNAAVRKKIQQKINCEECDFSIRRDERLTEESVGQIPKHNGTR